jgi:hypothetical protein
VQDTSTSNLLRQKTFLNTTALKANSPHPQTTIIKYIGHRTLLCEADDVSSAEGFVQEATNIVDAASKKGIVLRVLGATAVRIHCPKFSSLHDALQREVTDIDFMGYGKQRGEVAKLLDELGYVSDKRMRMFQFLGRYLFENPNNKRHIDVFFDKLEFCHSIDFKGRLEIEYPTISLSDIFLEKMQIVQINEKDIRDIMVLLREHEIGKEGEETLDREYISGLLSKDWGFYYTVTMNLGKVKAFLPDYQGLSLEDRSDIAGKIQSLSEAVEKHDKSLGWRLRAKTGTKQRWYREVDETGL